MPTQSPPTRRKGCLLFLVLALVAVLLAALYGAWRLRMIRLGSLEPISKSAAMLRDAPVDPAATEAVTKALGKAGLTGAKTAVVPLPDGNGSAVILVVDSSEGFKPAPGTDGKRKQARTAIKALVQADTEGKLDLQRVGFEYRENGEAWIALTAPMSALKELDAGKITEQQFLAKVDAKLQDPKMALDLLKRFQ